MYGYIVAQGLDACPEELRRRSHPREHHEAGGQHQGLQPGGLLPGVKVNTSATDFAPLSQLQLMLFKGESWERFGDVISSDVGG